VSLRINTNIPAMTAMRQLTISEGNMQNSITRLSTGLRINTAGDDPAGLIVSEGLRSQINGISQAIRNSQDAVNMSKTAEGALDEVNRLLQSMRALAVASANTAVVDANQLQANQNQIRNIVSSLGRIAEQTSWGNKKLLNGASGTIASVTNTANVSSLYIGGTFNGETVRSGAIDITRIQAATQTTTGALATSFATNASTVNAGVFAINGVSFTSEAGETVSSLLAKINTKSNLTGVGASYTAGAGITLTSNTYGSRFPIQYTETANILNGGASTNGTLGLDGIFDVTVPTEPSPSTGTERFTGGQAPGISGLVLTSASGNRMAITPTGNANAATTTVGSVTVGDVRFQIGANANQFASFSLPSVYATDLGINAIAGQSIDSVDITSEAGATQAIDIIDDAVQQLNVLRGSLGSFQQNFLESNVRSLGIAQENLTASESYIRDADMAYEMTEYTKINILRQTGMSVLAQASQAPQNILQLLRGG
jgi:flagellin